MIIVFIGLPGSGKGTQAQNLTESFGIEALSTGEMLRNMKTKEGPIGEALRMLPIGSFAPDELVLAAVKEKSAEEKYEKGILLDGFPRTKDQAEKMIDMGLVPDLVVNFQIDSNLLLERITGRRVHMASGRTYHIVFNPPKVADADDLTGEPLVQRPDDNKDVLVRRIQDHEQLTLPALAYLESVFPNRVIHVNATDAISKVWDHIEQGVRGASNAPLLERPGSEVNPSGPRLRSSKL